MFFKGTGNAAGLAAAGSIARRLAIVAKKSDARKV